MLSNKTASKTTYTLKNTQENQESINQDKYPKLVTYEKLGILPKLFAKFGQSKVSEDVFLGYCFIHKKYFLDHQHTDGKIRCPICDSEWLQNNGFSQ